ncbi:DNA-dependent ATPase mgs1 [Elasticomyces elasticus]|uniref:DNA-dependent ATPase mgs1 n=1 Tax=Exophiala sideris TaxID=1016849 RepID=A0ABR0J8C0_9EURO|nr:DNA-dependent ATPase mgs1 [Elasticomyces elasticus]KAK5029892.1 DNA-dependent ATPase mgs1 [Exophiala sideris]KAK5031668.1 DNA-dependent ATPase mgs1 [Exophiala sideris]KAK5058346.1 DNA-dependent ATPase mgs1 [Exophiala sideris]KAK5180275.1 DNA-dependent ATPase mgs1 [Eurotiomycetes sp. CCFEE 6388]
MVACPICGKPVKQTNINNHIDSNCVDDIEPENGMTPVSSFFKTPVAKRDASASFFSSSQPVQSPSDSRSNTSLKRSFDAIASTQPQPQSNGNGHTPTLHNGTGTNTNSQPPSKKHKTSAFEKAAPLAERMRPRTLDDVYGQDLVGPSGVLRGLIEQDRVPSMILWGGAGTGKTTIARVIASMVGSRFVEINSTSSGVAECKKIFAEARSELGLTGRKTIIFCDEIHRFSKSQQDVFLGPVEAGHVTLIGATTENPSFKVQNALLSRCRTFTLQKLTDEHICRILTRALEAERNTYNPSDLVNDELIRYLSAFADGDARTALNLLELAMDLSKRDGMDMETLKQSLTKTLVYDRAGDQHYDTISAFHKSVRGGDADAALYYLARMIQSGEDALYIARRMIVIASEDVGLADPTMLPLATAAYTAAEKVGLPEARINLAHVTVALCLAPKSTRAYRGLGNAMSALQEPGVAGLPIPIHLRNAPTRLMKELGYGKEYKYNPNYKDGKVKQEYLPDALKGRKFLEDVDLGEKIDEDSLLHEKLEEGVNGNGHAS